MNAKVIPLHAHQTARPKDWKSAESSLLLSGWLTGTRPIDGDIRYGLRALRARAREGAQDVDHVRHFLRLCQTNIIGRAGIQLRPKPKLRNGKPDKRAQGAITEGWLEWGERGVCDVTGQFSWQRVTHLAVEHAARDGEVFIRSLPGWEDNRFAFAVQLFDPEAVDVDYNEALTNGRHVVMGVELDEWRRPRAFYVNPEQVMPWFTNYDRVERIRVPAEEIVQAYIPEWIWQTRGIPWVATPLMRLKMLDGYEDAAVTASRGAASKMAAYTQDPDAPGDPNPDAGGKRDAAGNLVEELTPGGMVKLPMGWDIKALDWGWPNADHGVFEKAVLRNIASGLGVAYNTLANDLEGVNYSSLRHGMASERDVWRLLQAWFVETVCTPVYRKWLNAALISGALSANGRELDPLREREYRRAGWRPRGWEAVDPEKQSKSNKENLGMRTKSVSGIIREAGDDPEEVWEELAEDIGRLNELGIPLQLDGDAPSTETVPPPTEE